MFGTLITTVRDWWRARVAEQRPDVERYLQEYCVHEFQYQEGDGSLQFDSAGFAVKSRRLSNRAARRQLYKELTPQWIRKIGKSMGFPFGQRWQLVLIVLLAILLVIVLVDSYILPDKALEHPITNNVTAVEQNVTAGGTNMMKTAESDVVVEISYGDYRNPYVMLEELFLEDQEAEIVVDKLQLENALQNLPPEERHS